MKTIRQAAELLGVKPVTVHAHIAKGNLRAVKLGSVEWFIPDEELARFARERRRPGRPTARKKI